VKKRCERDVKQNVEEGVETGCENNENQRCEKKDVKQEM
jgi:hypothetical protein